MGIFKEKYIGYATAVMTDIIQQEDKSITEGQIREAIEAIYKAKVKDPSVYMDNNVTGSNANITLTKLCAWLEKEKPIISGNATFYCQPSVLQSPESNMVRQMKANRKSVKAEMFKQEPGSPEYQDLDLAQQNIKVLMNALYGGSGTPTAAFYTKYSPPATTLMAQSIITTMAAFFEGFVGDNQLFFSINECIDWIKVVKNKNQKIPRWVVRPSLDMVYRRIRRKFIIPNTEDWPVIELYLKSCNRDQLTYLYYANNLKAVIANHPQLQQLLREIMIKLPVLKAVTEVLPDEYKEKFRDEKNPILAYNRWMSEEMFLNPYDIPDCIKPEMTEFVNIVTQFVYVEYLTPDSIVKLNNHERNTVLLVDTDSNMINANLFVSFVLDELFPGELFGRERMYDDIILANVLAATLSPNVASILDLYGRKHNIGERDRKELSMKNEFMFRRFFLMRAKKRYAASIIEREGNIVIPFVAEIKGMDFIKAGVTEEVSNRFKQILCDNILFSEELQLHQMMCDLKQFEQEIRTDLKVGGTSYVKQEQYKLSDAYKKIRDANGKVVGSTAWRMPTFVGAAVWNEIYPENKINSLDRVNVVRLINKPSALEAIKDKYPDEYNAAVDKILNSNVPEIRKNGLKYICIPVSVKTIPEWIIPLIDIDDVAAGIMSTFQSVLDALNLEPVVYKTQGGKAVKATSCLISI